MQSFPVAAPLEDDRVRGAGWKSLELIHICPSCLFKEQSLLPHPGEMEHPISAPRPADRTGEAHPWGEQRILSEWL